MKSEGHKQRPKKLGRKKKIQKKMGLKPYVVTTYQGGVVTCASNGENAWDDMICTLSNRYLDYSIIDINVR